MFRRFFLLFVAAVLTGIATNAYAARFTDLAGSGYDHAIEELAAAGIITGDPDGAVRPYHTLNRAESVKVIFSAQSHLKKKVETVAASMPPLSLFYDVDQRAWYAAYVEAGFQSGIVKGYPNGSFRPGNTLTVEEALALLLRSYNESGANTGFKTATQLQNRPGEWFTPYVNVALEKNLISSRETLSLGHPISRGQFFDIVYRLRHIKNGNFAAYAETAQDRLPVGQPSIPTGPIGAVDIMKFSSQQQFAITMPSLGIYDLPIVHPDDPFSSDGVLGVLDRGVGHLFGYPGEGGKIMVYGHSSGYPWDISEFTKVFRRINELNTGDRTYVTYGKKLYVYEVTREQTVDVDDATPFQPDGNGEELILYTCWPPDTVDERYLVHLKPIQVVTFR